MDGLFDLPQPTMGRRLRLALLGLGLHQQLGRVAGRVSHWTCKIHLFARSLFGSHVFVIMLLVTMDGCSFSQCRRVVCLHDSNYIQNSILYGYPFCIRLTKLLWRSDVSSSTLALRQQRCTRGEVGLHKFHTVTIDVSRSTLSLRQQDLLPHKSESYAHILYPAKQHRSEAPVGDAFCVSGLQVRGGLSTGRWLTGGTSAGKNGSCMYQDPTPWGVH